MNQKTVNFLVSGAAFVGGYAIGNVIGKTVMKKAPQLEPLIIWTSGVLIGASVATLFAPQLITKSQAASVLASD